MAHFSEKKRSRANLMLHASKVAYTHTHTQLAFMEFNRPPFFLFPQQKLLNGLFCVVDCCFSSVTMLLLQKKNKCEENKQTLSTKRTFTNITDAATHPQEKQRKKERKTPSVLTHFSSTLFLLSFSSLGQRNRVLTLYWPAVHNLQLRQLIRQASQEGHC